MDILQHSAMSYKKLINYEYELTAGSKGKLIYLTLFFAPEHFAHLIGLHKLTDLPIRRNSYKKLFEICLNGELPQKDIEKSVFYKEIEERICLFSMLENILNSNEIIIKYKRGFAKGTLIEAEYIITFQMDDKIIHYFLERDQQNGKYFGKSFFARKDNKYLKNQQTYKILRKLKTNHTSDIYEILINKPIKP